VILTPSYNCHCVMNSSALSWSPLNISGGLPMSLSPHPPGTTGAGGPPPPGNPPGNPPPLGNPPPPGNPPGGPPIGGLTHLNRILGGSLLLPAVLGGSG
jgi:hypothetical protein